MMDNKRVRLEKCSRAKKRDRRFLCSVLMGDGLQLQHVPAEFKDDKELVLLAVKNNPLALQYASLNLRGDWDVVLSALPEPSIYDCACYNGWGLAIQFVSKELVNQRKFAKWAISIFGPWLEFLPAFQRDKSIVKSACIAFPSSLRFAAVELLEDKQLMISLLRKSPRCFFYIPTEYQKDALIQKIIRDRLPGVLEHYSPTNRRTGSSVSTLGICSEELKDNKEFVIKEVKKKGSNFPYASARLREDIDVVAEAIRHNEYFIYCVPSDLRKDPAFAYRLFKLLGRTDLKGFPKRTVDIASTFRYKSALK